MSSPRYRSGTNAGWTKWRNTLQQAVKPQKLGDGSPKNVRNALATRRGSTCSDVVDETDLPPRDEYHGDMNSLSSEATTPAHKDNKQSNPLTLWSFVLSEMNWGSASTWTRANSGGNSSVTAFLATPIRLEQFLMFGHALCVDLFLFHFTLLPLRVIIFACKAVGAMIARTLPFLSANLGCGPVITRASMYDIVKVCIIVVSTTILGMIQVSRVYHYIRGEAIIKLYVIFNILEILDKLCASLGSDIIDALHRAVRDGPEIDFLRFGFSSSKKDESPWRTIGVFFLRTVFTIAYVTVHACVIFLQIVCLNVALNSKNNSLLTLLISNNFVELKASVFKKFEPQNLFQVSCADAVERFQMMLYLLLIALQEGMTESLGYSMLYMWIAELIVDWVKHSLFSKFNKLHPELYPTFAAILGHDALVVRSRTQNSLDPTHACVRRVGLSTLPLACVVLRMCLSKVHPSWFPRISSPYGFLATAACLGALACLKMLLSMLLLVASAKLVHVQKQKQALMNNSGSGGVSNSAVSVDTKSEFAENQSPSNVQATPLLAARNGFHRQLSELSAEEPLLIMRKPPVANTSAHSGHARNNPKQESTTHFR